MRILPLPTTDDFVALEKLRTSKGKKAKTVAPLAADIKHRYQVYEHMHGDPWLVAEDGSFTAIRKALNDLYSHPPKSLQHLKGMRRGVEGACPMCGRDGLGTLDHYLPKSNYAEFSFFSRNLIPACDRCNNARNNLVRGLNPSQRPVHPYYDGFLANRVMTVDAQPNWLAPKLTPVPYGLAGAELEAVQWHIDNVVRPAGIDAYLRNLWGALVRSRDLLGAVPTRAAVADSLERQMRIEAVVGHSENAWRSCFYHGISANDDALDYLVSLI